MEHQYYDIMDIVKKECDVMLFNIPIWKIVIDAYIVWVLVFFLVKFLVSKQTPQTLAYPLILPNGETKDLNFLICDYVDHLEHHLNQIYH